MEAARTLRVVCFTLARQQFAAPIHHVRETVVLRPITRVFLTPEWLAGIINLRGDVVAVVDLAAFFGLGQAALGPRARIVIAHSGEPERQRAGFLVDRLGDVRVVELGALQPTSMISAELVHLTHGLLTQADGAPLTLLDVPRIFDSERLRQYQRKA